MFILLNIKTLSEKPEVVPPISREVNFFARFCNAKTGLFINSPALFECALQEWFHAAICACMSFLLSIEECIALLSGNIDIFCV